MDVIDKRKELGARLKALRISRNLTAYRVAKGGGINTTQVKVLEEATKNYTIDTLFAYLEGCGIENPSQVFQK